MTSHNLNLDNGTADIYDNNAEIICAVSYADLNQATDVDQSRLGKVEKRNNLSPIICYLNEEEFGLYKNSGALQRRNKNTGESIEIESNIEGNADGRLKTQQVKDCVRQNLGCDHGLNLWVVAET